MAWLDVYGQLILLRTDVDRALRTPGSVWAVMSYSRKGQLFVQDTAKRMKDRTGAEIVAAWHVDLPGVIKPPLGKCVTELHLCPGAEQLGANSRLVDDHSPQERWEGPFTHSAKWLGLQTVSVHGMRVKPILCDFLHERLPPFFRTLYSCESQDRQLSQLAEAHVF